MVSRMPAHAVFPDFRFDRSFEIPGLETEASAITFNPVTGNLLVVADEPAGIVEFTPEGEFVRRVKLKGFKDTEGLCHLEGHRFGIVEERKRRVTVIDLSPGVDKANDKGARFNLDVEVERNKGLEGATYDAESDTLFTAREAEPRSVFRVCPFLGDGETEALEMALDLMGLRDLSDLYFDPMGPWLWVLSDESRAALVFDELGAPVAKLSFERGSMGLPKAIPQAEGVTRDGLGRLFICSEPNVVYRFDSVSR